MFSLPRFLPPFSRASILPFSSSSSSSSSSSLPLPSLIWSSFSRSSNFHLVSSSVSSTYYSFRCISKKRRDQRNASLAYVDEFSLLPSGKNITNRMIRKYEDSLMYTHKELRMCGEALEQFGKNGDLPGIREVLSQIEHSKQKLTIRAYTLAFRGLLEGGHYAIIHLLRKEIEERKFKWTLPALNFLLESYAKDGSLEEMKRLWEEMKSTMKVVPQLLHYTMMIKPFVFQKKMKEADELLKEMIAKGILPSDDIFSTLRKAYQQQNNEEKLKELKKLEEKLQEKNEDTYDSLLEMRVRTGTLQDLVSTYLEMRSNNIKPTTVTYTLLLKGAARWGTSVDLVISLLEEMKVVLLKPDEGVYYLVSEELKKKGDEDGLLTLQKKMEMEGIQLTPNK